jgi:CDP-glucose 4,6-dehydratase
MSFWQGKRVLVTGANGFIGGNLTHHLVGLGADVTALERNLNRKSLFYIEGLDERVKLVRGDLSDRSFIERVLVEGTIEFVFHLAAQVEVGVGMQSPYTTFETNIRGTYTLLDGLRTHAPALRGVVVASTDKAYGEYPAEMMPYREHYPLEPRYPYDTSKACSDMIAQSYASDVYRLPIVVTRFSNIFGPGQLNFSALIPDAIRGALGYTTFVPRGDGSHVRDFLFVGDVVKLYARIGECLGQNPDQYRGNIYNAGTNEPRSVRDVIESVFRRCNNQAGLQLVIEQMAHARTTGEISTQFMNFDVVLEHFGWQPTTPFRDGLDQTIDWFRSYLSNSGS